MAEYTIDIPGLTDIFIFPLPPELDKQLRLERIRRWKTRKTAVPDPLHWIPGVINQLDDAQDLLYTAWWLAKPLLRRLPKRLIKPAGWFTTTLDLAQLLTVLLGMTQIPGITKPDVYGSSRKILNKFKHPEKALKEFLNKRGWRDRIGFAIQAAQALQTLTGFGIQIGSIFGGLSDAVWGLYRYTHGAAITVRLPPPQDLFGKACRFLLQSDAYTFKREILSEDDIKLWMAAHNVAIGAIQESIHPINEERANTYWNSYIMKFSPWKEDSIEACLEEGIPIHEETKAFSPYPWWRQIPNYHYAVEVPDQWPWERFMKETFPQTEETAVWTEIFEEAGRDSMYLATGVDEKEYYNYPYEVLNVAELANATWKITPYPTDEHAHIWERLAAAIAWADRYTVARPKHWGEALTPLSTQTGTPYRAIPK